MRVFVVLVFALHGCDLHLLRERKAADACPLVMKNVRFAAMTARVEMYVYDLSNGLARAISPSVLGAALSRISPSTHTAPRRHSLVPALCTGKQVELIPHSSVVIHWGGKTLEYYFGNGIHVTPAGKAVPCEIIDFGTTTKTRGELIDFLRAARSRFMLATYSVFTHNSNHFSDEVVRFLTGHPVPKRILNMTNEALSTPRGRALRAMLEGLDSHSIGQFWNRHRNRILRRSFRMHRGLFLHNRLRFEPCLAEASGTAAVVLLTSVRNRDLASTSIVAVLRALAGDPADMVSALLGNGEGESQRTPVLVWSIAS